MPGVRSAREHSPVSTSPRRMHRLPPLTPSACPAEISPRTPCSPSSGSPGRRSRFRRLHHGAHPVSTSLQGTIVEPTKAAVLARNKLLLPLPGSPRQYGMMSIQADEERPDSPRVGVDSPLPQDLVDATMVLVDLVSKCQPDFSDFKRAASPRKPSRSKKPLKLVKRATFVNSIAKATAELELAEQRAVESRKARHAARRAAVLEAERKHRELDAILPVQAACRVHAARLELLRLRAADTVRACMASLGMNMHEVCPEAHSPEFVLAGCGSGVSSASSSPWPLLADIPGWTPVVTSASKILGKVGESRNKDELRPSLGEHADNESLLDSILFDAVPLVRSGASSSDQSRSCSICEAALVEVDSPPPRTPDHLHGAEVATISCSPTSDIGNVRWESAGQSLLESVIAEAVDTVSLCGWETPQLEPLPVEEVSMEAVEETLGFLLDSALGTLAEAAADADTALHEDIMANTADELVRMLCSGSPVANDLVDFACDDDMIEICMTDESPLAEMEEVSFSNEEKMCVEEKDIEEPVPVVVAMCDELVDVAMSPDIRSVYCMSPLEESILLHSAPAHVDTVVEDALIEAIYKEEYQSAGFTAIDAVCAEEVAQAADAEVRAVLDQLADSSPTPDVCLARTCDSCGEVPVLLLKQAPCDSRVLPGRAIPSPGSSVDEEPKPSEILLMSTGELSLGEARREQMPPLDSRQSFQSYYCAHLLPSIPSSVCWEILYADFDKQSSLRESLKDRRPHLETKPTISVPIDCETDTFESISPKRPPEELRPLHEELQSPDVEVMQVLEALLIDEDDVLTPEMANVELSQEYQPAPGKITPIFGNPDVEDFESISTKRRPSKFPHIEDEAQGVDQEVVELLQRTLDEVDLREAGFSKCPPQERNHADLSICDLSRVESMDAIDGALRNFAVDLNRRQGAIDSFIAVRVADAVDSAASNLAKDESFDAIFHAIQCFADAALETAEMAEADTIVSDVANLGDHADSQQALHGEFQLATPEGVQEKSTVPEVRQLVPMRVWTPVHSLESNSSLTVRTALQRLASSAAASREVGASKLTADAAEVCSLVHRAYVEACIVRKVKPNSRVMKALAATWREAAASQSPRPLRTYNFADAHLGDRGLIPVLLALAHDPQIGGASLANCSLHTASAEVLADFLRLHPTLNELDLGGNVALSSVEAGLLLIQALEDRQETTGSAPLLRLASTGLAPPNARASRGRAINDRPALRPSGLQRRRTQSPSKKVLHRRLTAAGVQFV